MEKKISYTSTVESASSRTRFVKWFFPDRMTQRGAGYYAWLLHRLTGMAIVGYGILHLYQLFYLTQGKEAYNEHILGFTTPLFLVGDVLLIAVLAYHGLNGLRITFFDMGWLVREQRVLFIVAVIATAVIAILSAY